MGRQSVLLGLNRKSKKWEIIAEPEWLDASGKTQGVPIQDQIAKINEFQQAGKNDKFSQVVLWSDDGAYNQVEDFKSDEELKAEKDAYDRLILAHEESKKKAADDLVKAQEAEKKKQQEAHEKKLAEINKVHEAINKK